MDDGSPYATPFGSTSAGHDETNAQPGTKHELRANFPRSTLAPDSVRQVAPSPANDGLSAPGEPVYTTPGWRFLESKAAIGHHDGSDWDEVIELPKSVEALGDRELTKACAKAGVPRRDRAARVSEIRKADRLLRDLTLFRAATTELAEAVVLSASTGFTGPLIKDRDVRLVESRKGVRVSERHGNSVYSGGGGSVGFKGVRVGVGGGSSSSYSRSVSYPAPDELTVVDRGNLVVTFDRVSFAGRHFVKNAQAGKIVDVSYQPSLGEVSIYPTTGTKAWHLIDVSPVGIAAIYFVAKTGKHIRQAASSPVEWASSFAGAVTERQADDHSYGDEIRAVIHQYVRLLPPTLMPPRA